MRRGRWDGCAHTGISRLIRIVHQICMGANLIEQLQSILRSSARALSGVSRRSARARLRNRHRSASSRHSSHAPRRAGPYSRNGDRTRRPCTSRPGSFLRSVKARLKDAGIDLPFPTRQILFHDQTEESVGDRARQREGWPTPASRAQSLHEQPPRTAWGAQRGVYAWRGGLVLHAPR